MLQGEPCRPPVVYVLGTTWVYCSIVESGISHREGAALRPSMMLRCKLQKEELH